MNRDEAWLDESIKGGDFVSMIALFGWGRHTNRLNSEYKPLTYREIAEEAGRYGEYRKNFGIRQARQPTLSFVIVANDSSLDLSNLKRWYEFDVGGNFGAYTLYKVKLKSNNQ